MGSPSFPEALEEHFLPVPASKGTCILWLMSRFHLQGQQRPVISHCLILLHLSSTFNDSCDYIRPIKITQDNLLIVKYLIRTFIPYLPWDITHSQVLGFKAWRALGGYYFVYHTLNTFPSDQDTKCNCSFILVDILYTHENLLMFY